MNLCQRPWEYIFSSNPSFCGMSCRLCSTSIIWRCPAEMQQSKLSFQAISTPLSAHSLALCSQSLTQALLPSLRITNTGGQTGGRPQKGCTRSRPDILWRFSSLFCHHNFLQLVPFYIHYDKLGQYLETYNIDIGDGMTHDSNSRLKGTVGLRSHCTQMYH